MQESVSGKTCRAEQDQHCEEKTEPAESKPGVSQPCLWHIEFCAGAFRWLVDLTYFFIQRRLGERRNEPVTLPRHGLDESGTVGGIVQRRSQLLHYCVQA